MSEKTSDKINYLEAQGKLIAHLHKEFPPYFHTYTFASASSAWASASTM